ncbi:MAG: S-layer homology domain-containing protein [Abditibacteriota bacterium]|nr:S-layer homology domain-containing protein [Abditibacteriota bacterium]
MKKLFMLMVAVILMAAPAFSQNAFSDVPRDHWAYGAVSQLAAAGILEGYPDGTFQGKRTLTRYEYAMIIARLLPFLSDEDINVSAFATKKDLDGYAKLSDIKGADLSGVASKADLDAIAKLANEFKAELAALGVDVNALNADLAALRSRVSALEDEQARVKITGELTLAGMYTTTKDGDYLLDYDRAAEREGSQGTQFMKDFQINVKGRVNSNINAYLTLVAGDYMRKKQEGFGAWKTDVSQSVDSTVLPYYMYATVDAGKYGDFKIGRMPMQINKYIYLRADADSYIDIERTDNGDYQFGGVDYNKSFGAFDIRAWFGQPTHSLFYDTNMESAYNLQTPIKDMAGIQLGFNISEARIEALINYNEAFNDFEGCIPSYVTGLSKSVVYGGTVAIPFGSFALDGGYFVQKTKNLDTVYGYGKDNPHIADANISFESNGLTLGVGYLDVEAGYNAPGDYEGMAYVGNPDNIKGFKANAAYDFGNFNIFGEYKQYKTKDDKYVSKYEYDLTNDKIKFLCAGINYNAGNIGEFGAKYESLDNHGDKSNYITVSWLKNIGNANFKIAYQNINNKELENKGSIIYGQAGYTF